MENYFFLENYNTLAVSHNVLYHQPLPITRYQERFYANNYFELLPIVSTALKVTLPSELKSDEFACMAMTWKFLLQTIFLM